jgi:hypothetical protein
MVSSELGVGTASCRNPKMDEQGDVIHQEVGNRDVSNPFVVVQSIMHTSIDFRVVPLSHEANQKEVSRPSPIVTLVAELKICL